MKHESVTTSMLWSVIKNSTLFSSEGSSRYENWVNLFSYVSGMSIPISAVQLWSLTPGISNLQPSGSCTIQEGTIGTRRGKKKNNPHLPTTYFFSYTLRRCLLNHRQFKTILIWPIMTTWHLPCFYVSNVTDLKKSH